MSRIQREVDPLGLPNHYELLPSYRFFDELLGRVRKASRRIWIQTTNIELNHYTSLLLHYLQQRQEEGLDVHFIYDAYTYATRDENLILPSFSRRERKLKKNEDRARQQAIDQLQQDPYTTSVDITGNKGILRLLPFGIGGLIGMDHKKIVIIDDEVFIGGPNFGNKDLQRDDVMLHTNNPAILSAIESIFTSQTSNNQEDSIIHCDPYNTIITDGGKKNKSIILDEVKQTIDQENESIILISQYIPSGNLLSKLNRAVERGVQVQVITTVATPSGKIKELASSITTGTEKPKFSIKRTSGRLHSKVILFGNRKAVIGSHNFDEFMVKLGTKEVSLFTTEPDLITQVQQYVCSLVS